MAYDFRANQVRLNRIISSGSIPIVIYPASSATNFQGGKNFPDPGSDVFLFVSGSSTAKTAFGGDVVVSSSLRVLGPITASVISGSKTDIPALQTNSPNSGSLLITTPVVVTNSLFMIDGGGLAASNGGSITMWTGTVGNDASTFGPVFLASPDLTNDNATVGLIGTFFVNSGSSNANTTTFTVTPSVTPNSSDAVLTGSLQVRGGITGSISGTINNQPFIVAGPNITASYNSLGQWEITGSASGGSSNNYWISDVNKVVYTTGSANATTLSASLGAIITGSFVQGQPGNVYATGTNAFAHGGYAGSGIGVEARGNYSHAEGGSTITTVAATYSHAEGSGTQTDALAAHSEGSGTIASGEASHTEGFQTTAEYRWSHAEGYQTHARGDASHTEGNNTITSNNYAHAEGINTTASGLYSHTEGRETHATLDAAHAEGYNTYATNNYAHAEGVDTTAAGEGSHAGGHGTEAHANYQTTVGAYNIKSNDISLFVVGDGTSDGSRNDVFRVNTGRVEVTGSLSVSDRITGSLHVTNGGLPFIAAGTNITTKFNSLGQWEVSSSGGGAGGSNYWVSDVNNIIYTTGSAYATVLSASVGLNVSGNIILGTIGGAGAGTNSAVGTGAFVLGSNSLAYGVGSMANGSAVTSSGNFTHAEGEGTLASTIGSHAEGSGTTTIGRASHSEGLSSTANGNYSHTEGEGCQAGTSVNYGVASHAEGYYTTTVGDYSHAEGDHTETNNPSVFGLGMYAHAEGGFTKTYGTWSHAEGYGSIAYGEGSHAGGLYTIASGSTPPTNFGGTITLPQTAYGKYNKRNNTTSLFVVGDGTGDSDALRHDILRVESGSVQVTGSLAVNGGITGSIHYVTGTTPYLVGSGITVNYNGLGQYELSSSGGTVSNSVTVTGDGTNRGSGSISGLFGLSAGQIGKYEVQVVAVDSGGTNSATWKFSVSGFYPAAGSFSFLGINELTFDSTTPAATWDVNFNDSGQVEVTGSVGGTFFYTQITAKMIAGYGSVIF